MEGLELDIVIFYFLLSDATFALFLAWFGYSSNGVQYYSKLGQLAKIPLTKRQSVYYFIGVIVVGALLYWYHGSLFFLGG